MQAVKKRDGMKERFKEDKLKASIIAAGKDAGITGKRVQKIALEIAYHVISRIKDEPEITAMKLRGEVLRELDRIEPAISGAWRSHDRNVKGRNGK